jgi:hypothetical protein
MHLNEIEVKTKNINKPKINIQVDMNKLKSQTKYFEQMPINDKIIIDLNQLDIDIDIKFIVRYFKLLDNDILMYIGLQYDDLYKVYGKTVPIKNYIINEISSGTNCCIQTVYLLDDVYEKSNKRVTIIKDRFDDAISINNVKYIFLLNTSFNDIIELYKLNEFFICESFDKLVLFNINAYITSLISLLDVKIHEKKTPYRYDLEALLYVQEDTYLVADDSVFDYVGERINHVLIEKILLPHFKSFKKVCELVNVWNIVRIIITNEIHREKYKYLLKIECIQEILTIIKTDTV